MFVFVCVCLSCHTAYVLGVVLLSHGGVDLMGLKALKPNP